MNAFWRSFLVVLFALCSTCAWADKEMAGFQEGDSPVITPGEFVILLSDSGMVFVQRPSLRSLKNLDVKSQAESIIRETLAGPSDNERADGAKEIFPVGTQLEKVVIGKDGRVTFYLEFPKGFLTDPAKVESSCGYQTDAIIKSVQHLGFQIYDIQAREYGQKEYDGLDSYLPAVEFEYEISPDTASFDEGSSKDSEDASLTGFNYKPGYGSGRPPGALSGKAVYLNPGHGYVWRDTSDYWSYQRTFIHNNMEDLSNVDMVNQLVAAYCYNAGADVFSVREMDFNQEMVIVDNDDASGYTEYGSGWSTSSLAGFQNGRIPYLSGQNPFSYGTNRLATCVVGTPTSRAEWVPNLPKADWYMVYVSHAAFSNRSPQAHYKIVHAGGETHFYLDQRRRRFTWVPIGEYYFEAGTAGKVILYNDSTSATHYISADAVRFGGGVGVVSRGNSGVSGKPRRDESSRYHMQFGGYTSYDGSGNDEADTWTHSPRFGWWLRDAAQAYGAASQDSVFISSHTNAGGGSGLGTYVYNGYSGTWHDRFRNFVHDEVRNDIRGAYDPSFIDRGKHFGNYGENNPSNVGDTMPIVLGEWIFHDHAGDMAKYHDPKFRNVLSRAIYQGIVKFWAAENGTPSTLLPEPPTNLRCEVQSTTSVKLTWSAPAADAQGGHAATGYKYYMSTHGRGFPAGTAQTGTTVTLSSLTPGTTYYFYLTATNAGGESFPTETLAVKLPTAVDTPKMLIVSGFDKLDKSVRIVDSYSGSPLYRQFFHTMNTQDYIVEHAKAIDAYGSPVAFDSCEDECVESGLISLSGYDAVIWIGGIQAEAWTDDPTVDTSITSASQSRLQTYLNAGGRLFISGAEIAWDLDRSGTTTFVDNVLKANYVADDSGDSSATPASSSIFSGLNPLGFTNPDVYSVRLPDVISPVGGSTAALEYGGGTTPLHTFDTLGGWQDPNYSGSTNADPACTFTIVSNPKRQGTGAGDLYYVWGTGTFIREYNSSLPTIPAGALISIWVYGDNSGHEVRLCIRDDDGDLFANAYTTINFTGWREITWNLSGDPIYYWTGSGDRLITGDPRWDSIQIRKVTSQATGHLYFDDATYATGAGSGQVAAVQYDGTYRLLYMGFPFEAISGQSTRSSYMARILDFLLPEPAYVNFWATF